MSELIPVLATWLLRALAVGAGVLLLGWLAMRASRTPATRQRIASATVTAALLVPLLCALPAWVLLPVPPVPVLVPEVPVTDVAPLPLAEPRGVPDFGAFEPVMAEVPVEIAPVAVPPPVEAEPPPPASASAVAFDWRVPLLLGFGAVFLVLFGQLVRGHLALGRLWRESRPLPGRLAHRIDDTAAEVRVSDRIGTAVCFGFGRPRVLLPLEFARTATVAQLRWVMAHELDHARRGDHRAAYRVGLCRALFFAAPWFWLLRRDLRLSQEYLADAAAAHARPAEYAAFLVELISRAGPVRPCRAALAATGVGGSDLYRRVTMLLSPRVKPRWASRLWAIAVGMAVTAVAVLSSGLGVSAAPAEDPPAREKVKPAEPEKAKPAEPEKAAPKREKAEPGKPADLQELQRLLAEMIRGGNPDQDEIQRMVAEMQKQIAEQNRQFADQLRQQIGRGRIQIQGQGNNGVFMPFDPFAPAAPAKNPLREKYEKRLKEFDDEIAKAENGEAKGAIQKAREAYVAAMADELKKADEEAKKNAPAQGQFLPNFQPFPGGAIDINVLPGGRNLPFVPANQFGGRGGAVRARPTLLGVQVETPTPALAEQLDLPADKGVVVAGIVAGSPAEKAGLKKNDVLVKVDGKDVPSDAAAFGELVAKLKTGEKFDADVIRKGKKETVKGIELPQPKKAEPRAGGRLEEFRQVPGGRLEAERINFNQMQVQVNNGDVTITATDGDGVTFHITGTANDGKAVPDKIVIDDGGKKEYPSLDKVPEKHRAAVSQLLGQVRGFRR